MNAETDVLGCHIIVFPGYGLFALTYPAMILVLDSHCVSNIHCEVLASLM
jgi:hypothetical protein